LLPREGEKLEGLKASQDNTGVKVAPSATVSHSQAQIIDLYCLFLSDKA
jgi:hypothetical protein